MDSRFSQKGKIWRDFAEDEDENVGGGIESDSNSDSGRGEEEGQGSSGDEKEVEELEELEGSEEEEVRVHVAVEKEKRREKEKQKKEARRSSRTPASSEEGNDDDKYQEDKEEDDDEEDDEEGEENAVEFGTSSNKDKEKRVRKSSVLRKDAEEYRDKLGKRGVLYISRVPRKMNPDQARSLLGEYGEITRIYLAEEDAAAHRRRAASGGSATRHFVEGWVEFASKAVCKRVAASLNNTPISIRKGAAYVDERWNLKYLRKFKWDFLTEKLAYERRVREAKLKASMLQAKRSNAEFAEAVEKNKAAKHAQARIDKKRTAAGDAVTDGAAAAAAAPGADQSRKKFKRTFRQTPSLAMTHGENSALIQGGSLLGKVWKRQG